VLLLLVVTGFSQAEAATEPTHKPIVEPRHSATAGTRAIHHPGRHVERRTSPVNAAKRQVARHKHVIRKFAEHRGPHAIEATARHARIAERKPIPHPHPEAVARDNAAPPPPIAPGHPVPAILVSAHPAPVEKAEADRLAASVNRPAPAIDRSASDFVTAFLGDAFRIARTMNAAPDQRRADLADLMTTRMDLSRILVYATHAAYQAAPPEMRAQFRQSFASFLAEAYTPRIKLAAELSFTTSRPRPNQDGGITVSTTFTKPGIAESTIDWQLEPSGNSYKIVDVGSEGVSLLAIQRSSFTSVMANDGGLQGLLSKMDARTRELASAAK
jgi:phospholipid transport system substrate-binding protein